MILTGQSVYQQGIVTQLIDPQLQIQPSGVDLTVKGLFRFASKLVVDFDNQNRTIADYEALPWDGESITLEQGTYMVEYNETIQVPNDVAAVLYPRSSLVRSGVTIKSGCIESGYEGPLSSMIQVFNPYGAQVFLKARVALCVCFKLEGPTEPYAGVYQHRPLMP